MNVIVRILVGGLTGWLTGKAVEIEGHGNVVREGHVLDAIYGIVGAMVGEYLFFWIVSIKATHLVVMLPRFLAPSL